MTYEAFENAIMMANAIGGSTNAVLHLLAIAREAGVKLNLSDFEQIRKRTPHIADMRPGGMYVMLDLDKVGGVPVMLNSEPAEKGSSQRRRHDCDRQDDAGKPRLDEFDLAGDEKVVKHLDNPISSEGTLKILKGNACARTAP